MTVLRSILLFALAALAEIGGARLVDRYDLAGAALCLLGVAVVVYAPRPS